MEAFQTQTLAVGYHGQSLIRDISLQLERGKILTLIGPNGAGKSTILKSITRQLAPIGGRILFGDRELRDWGTREFAMHTAVVLTERIRPELMTCAEVVAMGRYPYTNLFGKLTPEDRRIVRDAMARVNALELADRDFSTLSDGQRQRILLARAICQQPEIIVLDEPTAYLDIRHKLELLDILRDMAQREHITVIMSLHEIDLAAKVSDYLLCVKGDTIAAFGPPEEILTAGAVERLYEMSLGSYDHRFGSVELAKPEGTPQVFVLAGGGRGIPVFRRLQKQNIPFAAGILYENDLDYPVAQALAARVITAPAFEKMPQSALDEAAAILKTCTRLIDPGCPVGSMNWAQGELRTLAGKWGIAVENE